MSKELAERLRADAESTDDIGLCADAADRIEELERRLEKALDILGADTQIDAEANLVALRQELDALQADRDEWKARAEFSYRQRDELNRLCEFNEKTMSALQADNARLREALDEAMYSNSTATSKQKAADALAFTPEQSLAEYRNKVIDECAVKADALANCEENTDGYRNGAAWCAEAIRAMKEQL
jgi:chromosome segregation ATPase